MYCDRCGTNLPGDVRFCSTCGRQFGVAPVPPSVNRVARNVKNLAILWIVYSALRILPGVFLRSFGNFNFPFMDGTPFMVHNIVRTVGTAFILTGVAGVVARWGLLGRAGGGRGVGPLFGVLCVFPLSPWGALGGGS